MAAASRKPSPDNSLTWLSGDRDTNRHTSIVFMLESQIRYIAEAIASVDMHGAQALAPTRTAQDRFNAALQNKLAGSVWNTGGCRSYYLDEHGYNHTTWSGCTWQYRLATRKLNPSEYRFWGGRVDTKTQLVAVPEVVTPQG